MVRFASFSLTVFLSCCLSFLVAVGAARGQEEGSPEAGANDELARQEAELRAAYDQEPGSAAAVLALGQFLCANGQGGEGLALLYRAVELDPKSGAAMLALVDALIAEHDALAAEEETSNAAAQLQRAIDFLDHFPAGAAAGPEVDQVDLRRVRVLQRIDSRVGEACTLALALVKRQPDNEEFHVALIEAATPAEKLGEVLALYDSLEDPPVMEPWLVAWFRAAALAARATYAFNHFGDDDQVVKDYAAADRQILLAAKVKPELFAAASERASFYRSWAGWTRMEHQKLFDQASDLFVSAWGREPTNDNAVQGMMRVAGHYYGSGELEKSREANRLLCVMRPESAAFWNDYGLTCRDTGQYEESFRAYRRAMELAPNDARIVNDCALILQYHLKRDLDLCERWLIRAEDLARAALEKAKAAADDFQINEQQGVLGDALTNLARLFSEQGRMQEAAENWNELRAVNPQRPELPENGGR